MGGGGGCGWRGHKDDCPGAAQSLMLVFSPLPTGEAGLSAVRGLSSAMGVGVSLLLQFSLASGGYQSAGRSRRYSRRSIPRSIPSRSWKKTHLQLHSLQGRVRPSLLGSQAIPQPQCSGPPSLEGRVPGGEGSHSQILEPSLLSVWPLGMSHVCDPQRSADSREFRRMCLELLSREVRVP